MSFTVRKPGAGAVELADLGITITGLAGTERDLRDHDAQQIAESADLAAAISGASLLVLDPRDNSTALSAADGELARATANDAHYGINGGRLSSLDDPSASITDGHIVQFDSGAGEYISIPSSNILNESQDTIGEIIGNMGQNGTDTTFSYNSANTWLIAGQDETSYDNVSPNGTFVGGDGAGGTAYVALDTITLSDGSVITVDNVDANGDVTEFTVTTSGETVVTAGVTLTQSSTSGTGAAFTLTPESANITGGTIQWDVDDSFLRNNGDTLDSGTLTIASGATLAVATGGDLTIADAPVNPTDAANKEYVDSVASGLDPKESVRYGTVSDPGGTYNSTGGTGGTGEYTAIDLTASGPFDGLGAGAIQVGDRLLIKNASSATENGIYVVTTAGAAGVIERSADMDGSPANEVSGGNFTFVENGTALAGTGWVVQGDGILTLNTDPINWVQFSDSASINPGVGISQGGQDFDLDLNDTLGTGNAVSLGDLLAFHDLDGTVAGSGSGSRTYARSFQNIFNDLDIPNAITANGIITRTAEDTYTSRSIAVDGAGNLDGLAVTNGDGVSGNPTLGLDIQNLPIRAAVDGALDRVAVWDSSTNTNVYYTVNDIAGAASASNSFATWAGAGNTSGDGSIIATSPTDTATLTGGIGITIDFTASTDTITYTFGNAGMADTAVVGADTVPFFDASNSNEPEFRSFTNIISDLGLLTSVSASSNEDELGIVVTGGDTIGIDIVGLTDPDGDMAATDEFIVHDKSEGTGGANRKMTGTNVAEGTADILGITGLTFDTFPAVTSPADDQTLLAFTDSTRSNKVLSVETQTFVWSDNKVSDLDWLRMGSASDSTSGHIMPLDGTIVGASAHVEDTDSSTFDFDVYIDGVDSGAVVSVASGTDQTDTDPTLNIDFNAGQKLRIRADETSGGGQMGDTVVTLFVKWRS